MPVPRHLAFILSGLFLSLALPLAAPAQNASAPADAPAIAATSASATDAEIAGRIRSIFAEIKALRDVTVEVAAGVVSLGGAAPSAEDIARAEAIASRVAGVVTVENGIERDLAVDSNLSPALGKFQTDVRGIVQALPLVGVAALIAALIIFIGYLIAGRKRLWEWITPNVFLAELVATSIRFVFIILGLITALEILGATALLGAVLGGAGVIGIAVGFAVRDTIDNYISSLMLSLRQPFRANDHVVIDTQEGRVIRLTSRATILMTLDGNHLRIPNSTVFKSVILNYTRNPERRFEFDLGVDADDNPVEGMAVGLAAINALDFVLDTPKADAIILDVGDSNIILQFHGWVDQTHTDYYKGRSLAIQAAKSALEDAGFALPEPIYRLRFDDAAPLQMAEPQAKRAPKAKRPPVAADALPAADNTAPEDHVARLVEEERAADPKDDLLDSRRPVE